MVRSEQAMSAGVKYSGLFIFGFLIFTLIPLARITAHESAPPSHITDYQGMSEAEPDLYEQVSLALTGETYQPALSPSSTALSSVKAVVLRSLAGCDGTGMAWDTLNSDWADYGSIPINVVYDDLELCTGTVTYEDLAASDADVVVISRMAGEFTMEEVAAIREYAEEGHNLFATASTFFVDNNQDLMPLFGLQTGYSYTSTLIYPSYYMENVNDPIFEGMTNTYDSEGYFANYGPAIGPGGVALWNNLALDGARFMAVTSLQAAEAAITFYAGNGYHAIYVSNAVEYEVGYGPLQQDLQFIYNALTYPEVQKAVVVKSNGCTNLGGWRELNKDWPDYGDVPIFVELEHDDLCSEVTYDALASTGADVVIVSSAEGGYTAAEIAAFEQYIGEGHNLIGTYKTLGYGGFEDNSLEPLFGLNDDISYDVLQGGILISQTISDSALFKGLPGTFQSSNFYFSQLPADDSTWDDSDLNSAVFAGKSADGRGVVTLNSTPNHHAIYISTKPENGIVDTAQQFLYNAISYGVFRPTSFQYLPAVVKGN